MRKFALRSAVIFAGLLLAMDLCTRTAILSATFLGSPIGCASTRHVNSHIRHRLSSNRISMRAAAVAGSLCRVKLEGKLVTDKNFIATDGGDIEMTIGYRNILEGLDKHVIGMNAGQTKSVRIASAEARGPLLNDMILNIPADDLPANIEEGTNMETADGNHAVVTEVNKKFVTLALAHPWAGKDLDLKVTLISSVTPSDGRQIVATTTWPGDMKNYPSEGDKVTLHYEKVNPRTDEVIESSRVAGAPVSFMVGMGEIDPGWDEAVKLISHGESAKVQIPSTMTSGQVADDDTVMQVELLEINGKKFDPSMRDMSKAPPPVPTTVFGGAPRKKVF